MTHKERKERRRVIAEYVRTHPDERLKSVAFKFAVNLRTVYNACKENNVSVERRFKTKHRTIKIVADLINTQDPNVQIAARYDTIVQTVSEIKSACLQAGIKLHPKRN